MENNFLQQIVPLLYEGQMTYCDVFPLDQSLFSQFDAFDPSPKTRGRKKLRPGNPLKTEVLDKYWLRAFKNFIKSEYLDIKIITNDPNFWTWYLVNGKPGKNKEFLSYNANYKKKLFENKTFSAMFAA